MELNQQKNEKNIRKFLLIEVLFSFVAFLMVYNRRVLPYNSTILAFSYKYGFISRGFIGTIYQGIGKILPVNMISYQAVQIFTLIVTLIFYLLYFLYTRRLMHMCPSSYIRELEYLLIFLSLNVVTMFAYKRNFGRLDVYMFAFTIIGVICIIKDKWMWMVVICAILSTMVHQGYVFMYLNIFLVLLLYQFLVSDKEKKKRYATTFIACLVSVSALFLYFEFFSHGNGAEFVDEIIANATAMELKGEYHETLVQKEILGVDLAGVEREFHILNFIELPIYLLFVMPYLVIGFKFFKNVLSMADTKLKKWTYRFVYLGSLTLLPCFIIKIDFARWIFDFIAYYLVVILSLMVMGDEIIQRAIKDMFAEFRKKPWSIILIMYAVLLIPFWDVHINQFMKNISDQINTYLLHNLW